MTPMTRIMLLFMLIWTVATAIGCVRPDFLIKIFPSWFRMLGLRDTSLKPGVAASIRFFNAILFAFGLFVVIRILSGGLIF